jgi:hypothetical protein
VAETVSVRADPSPPPRTRSPSSSSWPRTLRALSRRLAIALLAAAVVAAGCGAASTDGFDVSAPSGWRDLTRLTEDRSGQSLEAVWEGPKDGKVPVNIAIWRTRLSPGRRCST